MKLVSKVALSAFISAAVFPVALMSPMGMQQVQAGEAAVDAAELEEPVTSVESLTPTSEPSVAPEATVEAEPEETAVEAETEETADVAEIDSVESETAVETEASETEVITEETPATETGEAIGGAELDTETEGVESESAEGTY